MFCCMVDVTDKHNDSFLSFRLFLVVGKKQWMLPQPLPGWANLMPGFSILYLKKRLVGSRGILDPSTVWHSTQMEKGTCFDLCWHIRKMACFDNCMILVFLICLVLSIDHISSLPLHSPLLLSPFSLLLLSSILLFSQFIFSLFISPFFLSLFFSSLLCSFNPFPPRSPSFHVSAL